MIAERAAAEARDQVWLQIVEAGMMTAAGIGRMVGLSRGQVSRRLARARAIRVSVMESALPPESASSASAVPTLELRVSPNPKGCDHRGLRAHLDGNVLYCLDCEAISHDGGQSWLANHQTPDMAVMAPSRDGTRHHLIRLQAGSQADPGGPTSHHPDPDGLRGGRS